MGLALSPFLLAQGTMLAGVMADRIFFAGATLSDFKVELVAAVTLVLVVVLGPLLAFTPKLAAAKNDGLLAYGRLAERYVSEFDRKWLRGGAPADEPLIGSADIQSLADLANSYQVVRSMSSVPFGGQIVVQVVLVTLLPVLPLLLTIVSVEEVLQRLLKVLF